MQSNYLFVYGSLLSGFKNPAYEYITRYFEFLGDATANGSMYDLGEYPAAVPDETGRKIIGELYKIKDQRQLSYAIAQLDGYEGLSPEEGENSDYKREVAPVQCNNEAFSAWVYWFNNPVMDKPLIESGSVIEYLRSKNQP